MAQQYAKDKGAEFSNRIEKITIIGAGGNIGKHIVEQLLKTGRHTVTAITRLSSNNKLPDGIEVIKLDYDGDNDTALVDALRGQQVLIITMSVRAPIETILKLIRAAAKANVPYILPNYFGVDSSDDNALGRESGIARMRDLPAAEIKKLNVSSYIQVVSGFWYEFSVAAGSNAYGFDFKNRSLILFDGGNTVTNHSTWPQSGRAVAQLLSLKELPHDEDDRSATLSQFRNGPVYVSSFRLSQRDIFESVKRVTNTTDDDWNITHASTKERFEEASARAANGDRSGLQKKLYSRVLFPNGGGDFESVHGLDNELLKLPKEDLDKATAIGVRMGENDELANY